MELAWGFNSLLDLSDSASYFYSFPNDGVGLGKVDSLGDSFEATGYQLTIGDGGMRLMGNDIDRPGNSSTN